MAASEDSHGRSARQRDLRNDDSEAAIAVAQTGQPEGFAALYTLLAPRLAAFAALRGAQDPEGLVNEVFLKVFLNLDDFEGGPAQLSAWIFRIARNTIIDEYRKLERRPTETLTDDPAALLAPDAAVEDDPVEEAMSQSFVLQHLEDLTEDQRDVVLLRVVADLSLEQTAEVLGKPLGAVKALQHRAFNSLRARLTDPGWPIASVSP